MSFGVSSSKFKLPQISEQIINHFACEHLEKRITDQNQAWTIYLTPERMKQKTSLQKSTMGKTVRAGLHALPISVSKWRLQSLDTILNNLMKSMLLIHPCFHFATLVNSNKSTMEMTLVWPGVHIPPDPAEHILDPCSHLCVSSWGLSLMWSCYLVWGEQLLGFKTAHEVCSLRTVPFSEWFLSQAILPTVCQICSGYSSHWRGMPVRLKGFVSLSNLQKPSPCWPLGYCL